MQDPWICPVFVAGVRGIEPRSRVLETLILAVVLYPYGREIPVHCNRLGYP